MPYIDWDAADEEIEVRTDFHKKQVGVMMGLMREGRAQDFELEVEEDTKN